MMWKSTAEENFREKNEKHDHEYLKVISSELLVVSKKKTMLDENLLISSQIEHVRSEVLSSRKDRIMYNGDPFEVSIRPRTTSSGEDEARDSVIEMSELKHRSVKSAHEDRPCDSVVGIDKAQSSIETFFYDKEISEGDTLPSIALIHHVTVSELKRANNLVTDQDFHALRYIKVPLKKHGILAEKLDCAASSKDGARPLTSNLTDGEARPWDVSPDGSFYGDLNENYEADSDDSSETRALLIRTLSIRDSFGSGRQSKEARKFLEKMDGDLERIRDSTTSYKGSLEEVTATLTCKRITPIGTIRTSAVWNGADCGIRWWSALVCVIVVGLLVPLLYFIHLQYSPNS